MIMVIAKILNVIKSEWSLVTADERLTLGEITAEQC